MESHPYLIFSLDNSLYGVEALAVQEIFSLPELTPITEAPNDIVGVVNLRGKILPVLDLYLRFGYRSPDYKLTDSVIVLSWQEFCSGIIVNQVREVQNISAKEITTEVFQGRDGTSLSHPFVAGIARSSAGIVMLLNHENLIRYSEPVEALILEESIDTHEAEAPVLPEHRVFCPNATAEERVIFQERAQNLIKVSQSQEFSGLKPLAVIGLNGEYFGLDLAVVREFTDIRKVTPIPCTPPHVVGNMNLRGEILTLIDIRGAISLSLDGTAEASKAMVVHVNDLVAGVMVDEVFDVMYLNPLEIMPVPAAVHSSSDEFLRGTAVYREKMMGILDLPKIIAQAGLVVNEEI